MLPKSEFSRNVLTVMTGAGMAQAITIAAAPILTRLYTPDEFGLLYLFSSLSAILLIFSTGRYELAILLPKKEKEAANTAMVSGLICTGFSFLLLVIVLLFNKSIGELLGEPKISPWLYLLPISIFLRGWWNTFHYWHNRNKRFQLLTGSKFVESGTNVSSRIGMGYLGFGTGGLIVGTLLGQAASLFNYFYFFYKKDKKSFPKFSRSTIFSQAKRYKNFPKNMIPAGFFNVSSLELPNIVLNIMYSTSVVGFYGFMQRIVRVPTFVIGRSFDEVFKQKASEEILEFGHCRNIFYKTVKRLFFIAIIPFGGFLWLHPLYLGFFLEKNGSWQANMQGYLPYPYLSILW